MSCQYHQAPYSLTKTSTPTLYLAPDVSAHLPVEVRPYHALIRQAHRISFLLTDAKPEVFCDAERLLILNRLLRADAPHPTFSPAISDNLPAFASRSSPGRVRLFLYSHPALDEPVQQSVIHLLQDTAPGLDFCEPGIRHGGVSSLSSHTGSRLDAQRDEHGVLNRGQLAVRHVAAVVTEAAPPTPWRFARRARC